MVAPSSEGHTSVLQFFSVGAFLYHRWYMSAAEVEGGWLFLSVHACLASSASNTIPC